MPPYKIILIMFKITTHHFAKYRCSEESEPPLTMLFEFNHYIPRTFSSWLCKFWIGKLQRLSHIFTVWSYEPEANILEAPLNLIELVHFECALKEVVGLVGYLLSHIRICPSSWADNIVSPLVSSDVTTESLVRIVSTLFILIISVIAISWALEAETIYWLLIQFKDSMVPWWIA